MLHHPRKYLEQQKHELEDKERQQQTDSLEHLNAELERIELEKEQSSNELAKSNIELQEILEGISDLFKYVASNIYDDILTHDYIIFFLGNYHVMIRPLCKC